MPDTITATIGWSAHAEAEHAGREAAHRALEQLPAHRARLALVFGSSWFDQLPLLQGARSVLHDLPLAGESTAGEITPEGPTSHSCVVVLLASSAMTCSVGIGEAVDQHPREAGQRAAYTALQTLRSPSRVGLLLFGDGLVKNYAEVVRGLQEVLGTSSLIVGGMAGDDLRFRHTYQYAHDRVVSRAVIGVLLGGAVKMSAGIEHGFSPISRPRRITRAQANILFELDHHPAASVYQEYFGEDIVQQIQEEGLTRRTAAYPLGMQDNPTDPWLLRNVVSFGAEGSLVCSGEFREGAWLQLMIGSRELALEAAPGSAVCRDRNRPHLPRHRPLHPSGGMLHLWRTSPPGNTHDA